MKTLVAVPCFNEMENLKECLDSLFDHKLKNNLNFDILVVDDGSEDKSSEILSDYKNNYQ